MARIGVQEVQKVQDVQDVQKVQEVQTVQEVQKVQKVQGVQTVQGVQLRPIRGRKGIYWTRLNGIERKLNEEGDFRTVFERFWTNLTSPAQIRNFAMQFSSNNLHLSGATELLA